MTVWVRGFLYPEAVKVHEAFARLITTAVRVEVATRNTPLAAAASATLAELRLAYVDFNDGLRVAAQVAAEQATVAIRGRLRETQERPDTLTTPHLRDLIFCSALGSAGRLQTGEVGIARVSTLERAINRNTPGYGTYWRAQEYGTGSGQVPSQKGRVIHGLFASGAGGGLSAPDARYRRGAGPHPIFLPTRGSGPRSSTPGALTERKGILRAVNHGGEPGFGTIEREDRPRHFIGLGANAAQARWRREMEAIQQAAIDQIAAIGFR